MIMSRQKILSLETLSCYYLPFHAATRRHGLIATTRPSRHDLISPE